MIRRGVKPSRVAHDSDRNIRIGDGRRPSCAVDHVQDAAGSRRTKKDREQIIQARRREGDGDLKRVRGVDVYALVEEAVAAHTISFEAGHGIGDLEGCPAVDTRSLRPLRLARRVVGHLVLEEDFRAPIAVPHHLVFLVVLDEQAVSRDVVAVDDHARVGGVVRPAHAVAVVRPPSPDVVQNDVVAVHDKADRGLAGGRTADSEEHVVKSRWVGGSHCHCAGGRFRPAVAPESSSRPRRR